MATATDVKRQPRTKNFLDFFAARGRGLKKRVPPRTTLGGTWCRPPCFLLCAKPLSAMQERPHQLCMARNFDLKCVCIFPAESIQALHNPAHTGHGLLLVREFRKPRLDTRLGGLKASHIAWCNYESIIGVQRMLFARKPVSVIMHAIPEAGHKACARDSVQKTNEDAEFFLCKFHDISYASSKPMRARSASLKPMVRRMSPKSAPHVIILGVRRSLS